MTPRPRAPVRILRRNPVFRSALRSLFGRGNGAFLLLMSCAVAAAALAAPIDYPWTLELNRYGWPLLSEFMGRSAFEGDGIGGSDFAIFFIGAAILLYGFYGWSPLRRRIDPWRPYLGFVFAYGFLFCILTTHSLKMIIGRARPALVLKKGIAFTPWFEMGPLMVTKDSFEGSFPSGHTGLVFVFMALAYVLSDRRRASDGPFTVSAIVGFLAFGYALLMAVARTMSLSHWISDGMVTIPLAWLAMHALFHWVLRVPCQMRGVAHGDRGCTVSPFWEFGFCFYTALAITGLSAGCLWLRCLSAPAPGWMPAAGIGGWLMAAFFGRMAWRVRCNALADLRLRPRAEASGRENASSAAETGTNDLPDAAF